MDRNYELEALKYTVKLLPTEDHPLLRKADSKPPVDAEKELEEDRPELEEDRTDSWSMFKEEVRKHSEVYLKEDENIELIENTTESMFGVQVDIQKEVKAGRGKSRIGVLEGSAKTKIMETFSITKTEYKKQMKILLNLLPKVSFIKNP